MAVAETNITKLVAKGACMSDGGNAEHQLEEIRPADRAQEDMVSRLLEIRAPLEGLAEEARDIEQKLDESIDSSVLAFVGDQSYRVAPVRSWETTLDYERFALVAPDLYARIEGLESVAARSSVSVSAGQRP